MNFWGLLTWPNEFDRTMTKANLNNWTWPKLKPTTLLLDIYMLPHAPTFVGVVNFGQTQKLRFVGVKSFWSCSTTTFGHLHSVKLTSLKFYLKVIIENKSFCDEKKIFTIKRRSMRIYNTLSTSGLIQASNEMKFTNY